MKVKKKPRVQFQEDERLKPPPYPPRPPSNLPPIPNLKPLERRLRTRDPGAPLTPLTPTTPKLTPSKSVPSTPTLSPLITKGKKLTETGKQLLKALTPKGKQSKKLEHSYHLRSKDVQDGLESWQDYGSLN